MVLLFGYVLGSSITVPGGNYRAFLMPGLFAMSSFIGVMATTMASATDAAKGVMDRFRSMPMSRVAVPFGQTGADIIAGTFAFIVMLGCGFLVGWRPHRGVLLTLAAFGLLVVLRYAVSWVGVFMGLCLRNEGAVDQIVPLVFTATMVSNTFAPTGNMPPVLRRSPTGTRSARWSRRAGNCSAIPIRQPARCPGRCFTR